MLHQCTSFSCPSRHYMNAHPAPLPRLLGLLALLLTHLAAQAQNVGIGTTSPTQTLDVNGSLRVRAAAGSGSGRLLGRSRRRHPAGPKRPVRGHGHGYSPGTHEPGRGGDGQ